MSTGKLVQIFTAPRAGVPMVKRLQAQVIAGAGLAEDRYALDLGAFSHSAPLVARHVSLIEREAISRSVQLGFFFWSWETRRNLVVANFSLNDLIGKEFLIGEVLFLGVELCAPCDRPGHLCSRPDFKEAFENRGGLRAAALTSGTITVFDPIRLA